MRREILPDGRDRGQVSPPGPGNPPESVAAAEPEPKPPAVPVAVVGLSTHFGPWADRQAFQAVLEGLGYPYDDETENPVYRLFLR